MIPQPFHVGHVANLHPVLPHPSLTAPFTPFISLFCNGCDWTCTDVQYYTIRLFAGWFQSGLISTVFFSHNKPAPAELISPETNQRTY